VGRVVSVDMNYYLDTYHGSSYFMRWNRRRDCSGGLNVHKATHHFDLVQWWIGQRPVEVFAYGALNFFGPNGPRNPSRRDGRVCPSCDERARCAYYMRWHRDEWRGAPAAVALDEHVSGLQAFSHYDSPLARRCIYDSEIDIEDTYAAVVRYDGGAMLSYSLNCSTPMEGFRLGINGLDGRVEAELLHRGGRSVLPAEGPERITHIPLFGGRRFIEPLPETGGHGGADPMLRDDLFYGPDPNEKVKRMAPLIDGVLSVLTGVALHRSIVERRPIRIAELLEG
jgi:predicted dehydrogenase